MDDLIVLIAETYTDNDIGVRVPTETRREVWAHLRSITRAEWRAAGLAGLQPAIVAETPRVNYGGEKLAEVKGVRYEVYRTYAADDSDMIELYLEERAGVR